MAYFARASAEIDMSALAARQIAGGAERYDVIDTLARGSTADLLLAVRRGPMGIDSLVVLKRLRTSPADDARNVDVFLQEARVSVRLRHANIVQTFGFGEDAGAPFLVMEFLEGESLRELMRECFAKEIKVPVPIAVYIAIETLKGLHHAHALADYDGERLAFVHRDVSPHNIFVTHDGAVKLIDFGTAKTTLATEKTAEGVVKGKVAYLSPEQALGRELDPRTDLFSLGVTLWELLAGRRLMVGSSAFETMLRILNTPAPRLSDVTEGVALPVERVVAKALQRELGKRWQTAEEMRAALRDPGLCSSLGGPPAGAEELAQWMDYLFRERRAQKMRAIASAMRELAARGPRLSLAGLPVAGGALQDHEVSVRFREDFTPESERGGAVPAPEPSLQFIGPTPGTHHLLPNGRAPSSIPPPEESGERLSLPPTQSLYLDATRPVKAIVLPFVEPITQIVSPARVVAAEPLLPISGSGYANTSVLDAYEAYAASHARATPTDPMGPGQYARDTDPEPPGVTPQATCASSPARRIAWLAADLVLVAALGYLAGNPSARARAVDPSAWRDLTSLAVAHAIDLVAPLRR